MSGYPNMTVSPPPGGLKCSGNAVQVEEHVQHPHGAAGPPTAHDL